MFAKNFNNDVNFDVILVGGCLVVFSGLDKQRGDTGPLAEMMVKPYILALSLPSNGNSLASTRKKRAVGTDETCDE